MNVSRNSYNDSTIVFFDVDDSSALAFVAVVKTGDRLGVNLRYRSNPAVTYIYTFKDDTVTVLMNAIAMESAGKFAQYVRENADAVVRINADNTTDILPARKTMVTA